MRAPRGIGRQVAASMVAATVTSVVMAFAGLYLFYATIIRFAPNLLPENSMFPRGLEMLMMLSLILASAAIAFAFAIRLARRIVEPIVAVAESARLLADGDIKSRAILRNPAQGEGATLVADYNLLADRLEQASEALTRWNATIAHELRTPVTILSGRLQGLADGVFKPEPLLFQSLVTQVNGLVGLIEDLRTVTLMEGGHLEAEFARVELDREIEAIVALMRAPLEQAGFRLELDLSPGTADVDVARIRQALLALLENARRHAQPGTLKVRLQLTTEDTRIDVIDQGPGLPLDFVEHAFDPFRRHLETDGPVKGSGLGLSVVFNIARLHGGTASYESLAGGACFTMRFSRYRKIL